MIMSRITKLDKYEGANMTVKWSLICVSPIVIVTNRTGQQKIL